MTCSECKRFFQIYHEFLTANLIQKDKYDWKYYFVTNYSNGNRIYLLSLQHMKIPISLLPSLNSQLHQFLIQLCLTKQESTHAATIIMQLVSTLYQSLRQCLQR